MKDQGRWWILGEWCQGPYKTKKAALKKLDPLVKHEVFGNQFWWVAKKGRNKPYG